MRRPVLAFLAAAASARMLVVTEAPATVEEQRARLPPAADCPDSIDGVWQAFGYFPRQREWYRFTLEVHRTGDTLAGNIDVEGYDGAPTNPDPEPCRPGYKHFRIHQPAAGTSTGEQIDFHATSWQQLPAPCARLSGYTLDSFEGTIDHAAQEFVSVNRYPWGGQMVEDATLFRRIACFQDGGVSPGNRASVVPPPDAPPSHGSGCSCKPGAR